MSEVLLKEMHKELIEIIKKLEILKEIPEGENTSWKDLKKRVKLVIQCLRCFFITRLLKVLFYFQKLTTARSCKIFINRRYNILLWIRKESKL